MGFPLSAWDDFTIGMAINFWCASDNLERESRGERVSDPEEQYAILKQMEPQIDQMYAEGKIKQYKYDSYKQSLKRWEEMAEDGE